VSQSYVDTSAAAAIRIGVDRMVAHDSRMVAAARELGLTVFAPGTTDN
jgi:hypothetical protein